MNKKAQTDETAMAEVIRKLLIAAFFVVLCVVIFFLIRNLTGR